MFVRDYVQLQFDGITLNALTPMVVQVGVDSARLGEETFANLLIGRIGNTVLQAVSQASRNLHIQLSDGSSVEVSLRPEDYLGPEAINLWARDGSVVVL